MKDIVSIMILDSWIKISNVSMKTGLVTESWLPIQSATDDQLLHMIKKLNAVDKRS